LSDRQNRRIIGDVELQIGR